MLVEQPFSTRLSDAVPFVTELSLAGVVAKWRAEIPDADPDRQFIEGEIARNPGLLEPIRDENYFADKQEFLARLFSPLLPVQGWSNSPHSLCSPFDHERFIYATEAYRRIYQSDDVKIDSVDSSVHYTRIDARVIYAYKSILKQLYGLDLKVDLPIVFSAWNETKGLNRYFKLTGNTQFIDVMPRGPLPELPRERLQNLLDQDFDVQDWMAALPPENFLFRGVTLTTLVDITIEESTKRLHISLLNRQDIPEEQWMVELERELRNLFCLPDLRLGLATLQKNGELNFVSDRKIWNSLLIRQLKKEHRAHLHQSIYYQAITQQRTIIIENLGEVMDNPLASLVIKSGFRNLLLAPLVYEGKTIGILELSNPEAGEINGLSLFKIRQITPMFVNALKRHLDEFESKVEAVMLEEFTAIHPAIQWRFREAAIAHLNSSGPRDIITFEDLSPFYGSLDIRNSSKNRNRAIYVDLLDNLTVAIEVLDEAGEKHSLDAVKALSFEVNGKREGMSNQFGTDDETALGEYIRLRINPVLLHLAERFEDVRPMTDAYFSRLGEESRIFDRNRLAYECALDNLNRSISRMLEEEEQQLQKLVPCYFEKYQTDGIEYNIYLGKALAPQLEFHDIYIENLQLRQLIWTCNIARAVRHPVVTSSPECPEAEEFHLEIAPLVLAYSSRLTLKFQPDLKRLDVDGAYNVRYEIVKKRIDKAVVKQTKERLTQPDHLTVIYTQDREALVYQGYFRYLSAQGFISDQWENFELEPLQGVDGLRALRVPIL
ncbi:GAF domain-containing protein [Lewinella marina]|uniref:GAF domain-containing protein n=1 Tax=Neolewinella marina TaxID=438751 RepID=A0A2G0CFC2_9BACT|nr:GAF domain-containing protein [Neolewinella marina]NJB85641.1 GAF domain-containing protein [Neolewinella marina]PHK98674.1 hypothetical protein CGL56_09415 [Neolewinella marina]